MGVYSDALTPPGPGFWFVAIVGTIMTFVPPIYAWLHNTLETSLYNRKSQRGAVAVGVFSAVVTLALLHCFGDSRVLGWVYNPPDRSTASGFHALIVPFGPVFWLLVAIETVLAFMALRHRSGGWATLSLVATVLLVQVVTGVSVVPWVVHHWALTLLGVGGWIVIGVGWSFFYKWDDLVDQHWNWYNPIRQRWLATKDLTEASDFTLEDKQAWEDYFALHKTTEDGELIEFRPKYRDHKSELLGWATLWPVSLFETFLYDWLSQVILRIYNRLGGVLEYIMARRWKGTEGHMLTAEEKEILLKQRSVAVEKMRK